MFISRFVLFLLAFCLNIKNSHIKYGEYKYKYFLEGGSFISLGALNDKIICLRMRKIFDGFVGKDKINEELYYGEFEGSSSERRPYVKNKFPLLWKKNI